MFDETVLSDEIANDPLGRGYAGMTDQQAANSLLAVNRTRNRTTMTRQEVYENIQTSALAALTALQVAQLNLALSDTVNPFGNAAQVFTNIFGGGSATITALAAARVESVSRSNELGLGDLESASLAGWITRVRGA